MRLDSSRHVDLFIHPACLLTICGVTAALALAILPFMFPTWTPVAFWLVASSVAFTDGIAGLLHELGHASMALARGRPAYRITLYGLAASVRRPGGTSRPHDQLLIALAGPASHLLFACALWAIWCLLPTTNEPLRVAAGLPAVSNFAVGVLNLVPILPLDGARAARALVGVVRA